MAWFIFTIGVSVFVKMLATETAEEKFSSSSKEKKCGKLLLLISNLLKKNKIDLTYTKQKGGN